MKLYYDETLNPRKACALARHLQAQVEYVRVRLGEGENHRPEYLAINPNGKVPALTDGALKLWEANAIMCYLADKQGADKQRADKQGADKQGADKHGSELWPHDARQFEIVRWLSWDAEHFTRYGGTLYFEHIIKQHFGLGDPDPAQVAEATGYFRKYAAILADHLQGRRWLVGDALTVADFAVAAALPYAEAARIPLGDFPEVASWHDRLNALDAWRDPFPAMADA